jgi:hypothetical protein
MPGDGEPRVNAAEIYAHVQVRVVDLCAGTASESLLYPDDEPWIARSDIRQARAGESGLHERSGDRCLSDLRFH